MRAEIITIMSEVETERLRFWLHSAAGLALFSFCLAKVGVEGEGEKL